MSTFSLSLSLSLSCAHIYTHTHTNTHTHTHTHVETTVQCMILATHHPVMYEEITQSHCWQCSNCLLLVVTCVCRVWQRFLGVTWSMTQTWWSLTQRTLCRYRGHMPSCSATASWWPHGFLPGKQWRRHHSHWVGSERTAVKTPGETQKK